MKKEETLLNHKITQALERISMTFRVLIWEESKKYGLSPIQIQILIFCLHNKQETLKVSNLAKEFGLTKATVSDSVKILLKKSLVIKKPDSNDSRSYMLELTRKGKDIAKNTYHFDNAISNAINQIDNSHKGGFFENLLNIIHDLNKNDIITTQRMCLTCDHYTKKDSHHFCNLLNKKLHHNDLQINCAEHKIKIH